MNTSKLRLATWNCNGALRKKLPAADSIGADILIVQECEDPSRASDQLYGEWASNHLWTGPTKNKGIGVFARVGIALDPVPLDLGALQLFLPVRVNGEWPLLATWTMRANSPTFGYIGQLWKFLQSNRSFLDDPSAMLVGDLNSNAIWDVWDRWWNHSDVVKDLSSMGLESLYHHRQQEAQGRESQPTFYMNRNLGRPYHIDYAFAGRQWSADHVEVGKPDNWLTHSDHMPVVIDLTRNKNEIR